MYEYVCKREYAPYREEAEKIIEKCINNYNEKFLR